MRARDIWVSSRIQTTVLSQHIYLTMESVTTPALRQAGALLDPGLKEAFSHGMTCSVLDQPRGLELLLHQPGPCMDSGEQLSWLIMTHGCRGEGHKGVSPPGVVLSALSLLA